MRQAEHKKEAYRFYAIADMYFEGEPERVTALSAANFHATMATIPDPMPHNLGPM